MGFYCCWNGSLNRNDELQCKTTLLRLNLHSKLHGDQTDMTESFWKKKKEKELKEKEKEAKKPFFFLS
jgi:hypothetical protein